MDTSNHPVMIPVSISASGDNLIVASAPDAWLYVHQILLVADGGDNLVEIKKGSTILSYVPLKENTGFILENTKPRYPYLFDTEPNEDIIFNLSNASSVKGHIIYATRK